MAAPPFEIPYMPIEAANDEHSFISILRSGKVGQFKQRILSDSDLLDPRMKRA